MSPRRYAENTSVPISRSRGQIDELLRTWGATGLQWTDDFESGQVSLRFRWHVPVDKENRAVGTYMARFNLVLKTAKQLTREKTWAPVALRNEMDRQNRAAFRVLLLWLKAAFNAVDAGIVTPETLFLPFLEGKDGQTVAEIAIPRLDRLIYGSAARLLGAGDAS